MNKLTLLPLAAALALSACGGSSSPATPEIGSSSGIAVDGYLSGSTVVCDANQNGVQDAGEAAVTTDANGNFTFASACTSTILVTGGTDTATNYPFTGKLKAAAGSAVVTPLTTLLADSGLTPAQLATALGLPAGTDVTKIDPMADGNTEVLKKTLAVQQTLNELTKLFSSKSEPGNEENLYAKAADALAAALLESPSTPLVSENGTINTTILTTTVQKAVTKINADTTLPKVSVADADVAGVVAGVAATANEFLQADDVSKDALIEKQKELQNPLKPPVETNTDKENYIAAAADSFEINDQAYTLTQFKEQGVVVDAIDTIDINYLVVGNPSIDTKVDVAMSINEVNGQRMMHAKVEQVRVKYDKAANKFTLEAVPETMVHVFTRNSKGVTSLTTVESVDFDAIVFSNNEINIDYPKLVHDIANNPQNPLDGVENQFNSAGTFEVALAVSSNLNIRYANGSAMPYVQIGIPDTIKGVKGPGITGKITVTTGN